ncbi:propanol-preferring alcohol dehydrogenase [Microbacterium trichothecenolyticum]|uniref:alcohol dehydrogenase AdhP n=1 Tax=Microbacterium trichothecenolyticum TaxID=69370 RepID=UPI0028650EA9|nr:alcohol dehydrogenase AdhP [Microbacterium trichothecenolyticum]MDR7184107.1 propanol-preferring alcohol dehydrogenase [Microbacterium trichothecenolyticum]
MTILTDSHAAHGTATPTGTMRAAVVTAPDRPLEVRDVPIPTPGPGQALVKVRTTGVCHTDLHAARGDWPVAPKSDLIPGHEGYGRVVALGDGVTSLAVGDLVGNAWLWSACGVCEFCRTGWETLCPDQQNGGYSVDGSFGEYMLVDERFAARIPDGADPVEVAPILCAGVTVYKGLKMTEARPGEWVVISGIGGLGHIAVQYARAMGLRVAAVDIDDAKLELARRHGAELTVNALTQDPAAAVQERTGGAHGVLVTAVHPKAFGQALGVARRGATIVFNGLPPGDFPADIFDIVLRAITIRGSIVGTRQDMIEALDFYARGEIHPTVAVESIDDINDIFERMEHGRIDGRIVMQFE